MSDNNYDVTYMGVFKTMIYPFGFIFILTMIMMLGFHILHKDVNGLSKKLEEKSLLVDTMITNQYMMLLLYNRDHNPKEFLELNGRFGILWPTNK